MTLGLTPSQTVGPFFTIGLRREPQNVVVPDGSIRLAGHVLDGAGDPVPDALVELWQRGQSGAQWGRCGTDEKGRFEFITERPPDGFADVVVFARGLLKHLVTRCYFEDADDETLSALDAVQRETLIARHDGGSLRFDVHLQGDPQTVFFAV